uniref:Major facilitator superfamily (MFS) profile domain-containing protein n=1 Tax=Parascaris univalens TaxID=6257 RepID=A0A915CIL4_PARUN
MYRKEKGESRNRGRPEADVSEWVASNTRQANPPSTQGFRSLRFQPAVLNIPSTTYEQESESDSSSSTLFPEPLDGGYGWVIVLASFCIHFICDGISFSFGIMFPEIQQYFNATKTMSGVVGSIFLSIPLLSGPLAAVLTDIYDCRRREHLQRGLRYVAQVLAHLFSRPLLKSCSTNSVGV